MAQAPAVGDTLILDGVAREIRQIDVARGKCWFTNPSSVPEFSLVEVDGVVVSRTRINENRNGSCAVYELLPLETPQGVLWYVPGRLNPPAPPPAGAIVLEPAVYNINEETP